MGQVLDLLLGFDLEHVERLGEFVGYFKSPRLTRSQLAVDILDDLAGGLSGFVPGRVLVRQLFPNAIKLSSW